MIINSRFKKIALVQPWFSEMVRLIATFNFLLYRDPSSLINLYAAHAAMARDIIRDWISGSIEFPTASPCISAMRTVCRELLFAGCLLSLLPRRDRLWTRSTNSSLASQPTAFSLFPENTPSGFRGKQLIPYIARGARSAPAYILSKITITEE